MKKVLVLNGPNLNLLGQREPAQYGYDTLATVETLCKEAGERLGVGVECRQSNHEGVLIDWIHEAGREIAAGNTLGGGTDPGSCRNQSIALYRRIQAPRGTRLELHHPNS